MRTQRWFWSSISLMIVMAMFAASCSGGTTGVPGPGPADPPINQDAFPVSTSPDVVSQPATGVSAEAPLGTTAGYEMTPIVPVETATPSGTSRAGSALDASQDFAIYKATVTASNITNPSLVNFDAPASSLVFDEGKNVNLWIQYEGRPNKTFTWEWSVVTGTTTLMTYSADRTETTTGVKTFYMQLALPLDSASNADKAAIFKCDLKVKSSSVVIIPPDGSSVSVDFTIKNVPVTVTEYGNQGGAYMCWEDLLVNSDYDYNDFVGALYAKELRRTSDGKIVQISFTVKAIARGAGYDSDWQFNMDSAFPGATANAYIQRYSSTGAPKGSLVAWSSSQGVSIPVFVSNATTSLPVSPNGDGFSTNVSRNSTWVNGDYAQVTIVFNSPVAPGSVSPIPYKPELRVKASSSNIYVIKLWSRRGDPVDSNGRPLGFIIPDNFAWMMEGRKIEVGYPRFTQWVTWVNNMGQSEASQPKWWLDSPVKTSGSGSSLVYNTYQPSLFGGGAPTLPISFPKPS